MSILYTYKNDILYDSIGAEIWANDEKNLSNARDLERINKIIYIIIPDILYIYLTHNW